MKSQPIYKSPLFVIPLAGLLFMIPAIIGGIGGADWSYHVLRAHHFSTVFWDGTLFPRWLPDLNTGCGEPTFYFYPPLAFYIRTLFHFLELIPPERWWPMILTGYTIILAAGYFCYMWLQSVIKDKEAALMAAVTYMMMPYVSITFHSFFAIAEFLVFVWTPLLLFFAREIAHGKTQAIFGYAIAVALLLMSSIPGTIIVSGLPILYFFFCVDRKQWLQRSLRLGLSLLLGFGLSAIYVLPMVLTKVHVRVGNVNEMWDTFGYYGHNFLLFPALSHHTPAFAHRLIMLGVIAVLMTIIAYSMFRKMRSGTKIKKEAGFWMVIMVLALFCTSSLSKPIWELITILQVTQFPYRILSVITIACVAIISITLSKGAKEWWWLLICLGAIYIFNVDYALSERYRYTPDHTDPNKIEYMKRVKTLYDNDTAVSHEYLPMTTDVRWQQYDQVEVFAKICSEKTKIITGNADINVTGWQSRNITLSVNVISEAKIQVAQLYYPYWRVTDANNESYQITPAKSTGLIRFTLPPGQHQLKLTLEDSPAEKAGKIISLSAVLLLLGSVLLRVWQRRSR